MTDLAAVKAALKTQAVETPSWAYGNSGTRFKVFAQEGVPRTRIRRFIGGAGDLDDFVSRLAAGALIETRDTARRIIQIRLKDP